MIKYEVVSHDVDGYNPTAKKIRFEKPVETEEHGDVEEAVIVHSSGGMTNKIALYVNGELFIEGLYEEGLIWRLADISDNYELEIREKN